MMMYQIDVKNNVVGDKGPLKLFLVKRRHSVILTLAENTRKHGPRAKEK